MAWSLTTTKKDGIAGDILEGGDGKRPAWKRSDGWGRMTDAEVLAYKQARIKRYLHEFVEVP